MTPTNDKDLEALADRLLAIIRKKPGEPQKLEQLRKKLGVDEHALNAGIQTLADLDYKLRKRKDAVTFLAAPDHLTDTEISHDLNTRWLGKEIHAYRSTRSTNDIATTLADAGAVAGTIVVADEQTRGRGRLGRGWYSPPGTGVYVSIILRPEFSPERAPGISIMTAVALAEALTHMGADDVRIKWPNDVLIGGRKSAGILTELYAERGRIEYVVVGVGINVNQRAGDFPEEIRHLATSLRRATKKKANRTELLREFLQRFEKAFDDYHKHGLKKMLPRIKRQSSLLGETVAIAIGGTVVEGKAVRIDPDGSLVLDVDGVEQSVAAGEVTVVKK